MANRRLLGYADALATSFPRVAGTNGFDPARVTETGNPVRAEILAARGDYPALSAGTQNELTVVGGIQNARGIGGGMPSAPRGRSEDRQRGKGSLLTVNAR